MQMFCLHKSIYKLNRVVAPEEKIDPYFLEVRNKVQNWEKLRKRGVPDKEISAVVGISRASFYRYKKSH